ncbi:hypothetical protein FHR72_001730 [Mycolicibacterium iranicum]|uniref:Uncharacterized protein n=1 Tax=Mycolicibacterium iranicum TaxID=912594 RepID=A0A839QAI4_MYCIR|nr:AAA family ATPase [Mycolicibacterium iranicum]MBB2990262.1 hypothetical protein [Mycolicibacterium iranicum]
MTPISKVDLAARLGIKLPPPYEANGHNGAQAGGGTMTTTVVGEPEPVDNLWIFPLVLAALGKVTGDRSEDTARIIGACYDARLTLSQTRWVVSAREDLVIRLAERRDDDVGRIWEKIDAERRKRAQSEAWMTDDLPPFAPPDGTDAETAAVERSWHPVDLESVLVGDWQPPSPAVGRRSDGVGMFYPAKVHSVASESEGLKTWMLLAAAFDEIRKGNHVLFVDFEDDEGGVVGRLLTLQLSREQIRTYFHYVRPTEPLTTATNVADLAASVTTYRPTLAVVDGITEGMTMHGLNPLDNQDIAKFGRILPRRLARAGCATVCLDHVVKDAESRGRYALGGVHKLNAIDGAAFILEGRDPFGIGLTGRSSILIAKDRPGQLRKHAHPRKDKLFAFGELVLTSHDESYVEFEIRPDAPVASEFRPTVLMGKICAALAEHGPMSQRKILATVAGKREYAINALALLQRDGYVSDQSPHKLLRPWDES